MSWSWKKPVWLGVVLGALLGLWSVPGWPQEYTKSDRDLAKGILRNVAEDVQKHYYDPKIHGVDWQARVHETKKNIETAQSFDSAMSEIAALLDGLHDSHTRLRVLAGDPPIEWTKVTTHKQWESYQPKRSVIR